MSLTQAINNKLDDLNVVEIVLMNTAAIRRKKMKKKEEFYLQLFVLVLSTVLLVAKEFG